MEYAHFMHRICAELIEQFIRHLSGAKDPTFTASGVLEEKQCKGGGVQDEAWVHNEMVSILSETKMTTCD